jgi:hypothetical protein
VGDAADPSRGGRTTFRALNANPAGLVGPGERVGGTSMGFLWSDKGLRLARTSEGPRWSLGVRVKVAIIRPMGLQSR